MLSIGLALVYVWLRGGFIGIGGHASRRGQLPTMQPGWEKAAFAMGCFWSAESDFDKLEGREVHDVRLHRRPGVEPSYEQVHADPPVTPKRSRWRSIRPW